MKEDQQPGRQSDMPLQTTATAIGGNKVNHTLNQIPMSERLKLSYSSYVQTHVVTQ